MKTRQMIDRCITVGLCIVLLLFLCACRRTESEAKWDSMAPAERVDYCPDPIRLDRSLPAQTDELVLYLSPSDLDAVYMSDCIALFQSIYPSVHVTVRSFGSGTAEAEQAFQTALAADIAAGHGPDLIYINRYYMKDIEKAARSGAFLDLNPWLEGDPSFSEDDYVLNVFNAGVYGDERYYIPVDYVVDMIYTTQERLEETQYEYADDWEEFCRQMIRWGAEHDGDPNAQFTNISEQFYYYLRSSGIPTVDFDTGEVLIDNEEFRLFMEAQKAIYPMQWGAYMTDSFAFEQAPAYHMLTTGQGLYGWDMCPLFRSIGGLMTEYTPIYSGVPSVTGEIYAIPFDYVAVSSSARNPANAYLFLRVMIDRDVQAYFSSVLSSIIPFYPVSRIDWAPLYEEYSKLAAQSSVTLQTGETYWETPVPETWIKQYEAMMADVEVSKVSEEALDIVFEEMQPFLEGTESYETCMTALNARLQIYVLE